MEDPGDDLVTDDGGVGDAGADDDVSGASEGPGFDLEDILGFGCFPEDATVQVEHHSAPVLMKDLQVGDRVWTNKQEYSTVYAFGHRLPEQEHEFVQLTTKQGVVQLTGEHLIYLNGKQNPVRADSVQPGQVLQSPPARVLDTTTVTGKGLYAPFTTSGSIVVNGVAASSYISLQPQAVEQIEFSNGKATWISQHDFIHSGLSPLRMACLGISGKFCDETTNEQGMPTYIRFVLSLQQFVEQQHWTVQTLMMMLYLIVAGAFMMLEQAVGASEAPSAVAVLGLLYLGARMLRLEVRVKILSSPRV